MNNNSSQPIDQRNRPPTSSNGSNVVDGSSSSSHDDNDLAIIQNEGARKLRENSNNDIDQSYMNYRAGDQTNNDLNQTDISRLNITGISNNGLVASNRNPPQFQDRGSLGNQPLGLKKEQQNNEQEQHQLQSEYLSELMLSLKTAVELDDEAKFEQILRKDIKDSEEVLMHLYAAVTCFNSEKMFDILLKRNNFFQVNKEWYQLFSQPKIFSQLSSFHNSVQRQQFNTMTLKVSLDRDFYFMSELVLERSLLSKEMIQVMLRDGQKKMVVQMVSKAKRPIYIDVDQYHLNLKQRNFTDDIERELHFNDIVYAALDMNQPSTTLIELIKLMKNEIQSKFFEEPDKELSYKELFRIFIQRRKIKMMRFLFSLVNEFDFSPQLFIEALELEAYDIGALLYKEFFRRLKDSKKENEYIITILISSLNKNNGQLDYKAYLLRSYIEQFILRHAKHFLDTLDQKLGQENKFNILVLNLNVVKTSCLLIEILEMISGRFDHLRVRCKTLRLKIETLGQKYMENVDSEQEMRYLLLEKDFECRDALELITRYRITAFLESQFADNVVREIWRSPYATNNSLFSASTNHKLTFEYWNCIKDEEISQRFYNSKDIRSFEAHPLQFTVWRYSGKSRITVEFFMTAILAIIIHILINEVLVEAPHLIKRMDEFIQIENHYDQMNTTANAYNRTEQYYRNYYPWFKQDAEVFFDKVMVVSYLSFLPLMFAFQHIFNIIYASINKRMINPYSFLNLLDFLIFGIFFTNIMVTYVGNLRGTWMDFPLLANETRATIYCRNYYDNKVSEDAIWILCIVILWVRVFYFLRYNEFMGKFVGIIEKLIYEVFLFFCFYLLNLVFFALIAELCFRRLDDYNTSAQAFKTLFYASLGQFSFENIEKAELGSYFGITFMIIFLCVQIGLVITLFVSIITVLYDKYSQNKNIYQMLETLKLRSYTQAEKEYSAIVSLPPPLNVLNVVFTPFLLTSRNPECFNEFVLSIAYVPVMFGVTLFFILYNIVLLPFTYIKLFFHKLAMIYVYSKSYRVSRADKFITFVFFTFFGPFTLALNMVTDIWYFLRHLWIKDLLKTKHSTSQKSIDKETMQKVNTYFKQKQEKVLPFKQIACEMREQMSILDEVGALLRPKALISLIMAGNIDESNNKFRKIPDQQSMNNMFKHIQEYSTLKLIMERNSEYIRLYDSNQRVKTVDCKVMHVMIADCQRQKQIVKVEEEEFIFIRRSYNNKKQQKSSDKKKKTHESSDQNQPLLSQDSDSSSSKERQKRLKQLFKKLLFLNTKRMLEILGYKTGDTETKKLLHALKLDNMGQQVIRQAKSQGTGEVDIEEIEDKVQEMGQINPKLNQTLGQMRSEVQNLIQYLSNLQFQQLKVTEKEKVYQIKINELMQDLENIKEEKNNEKLRNQNFIVDYFQPDHQKPQQRVHRLAVDTEEDLKIQEIIQEEMQFNKKAEMDRAKDSFHRGSKQHAIGQPSPTKEKHIVTESDVPDVDDSE